MGSVGGPDLHSRGSRVARPICSATGVQLASGWRLRVSFAFRRRRRQAGCRGAARHIVFAPAKCARASRKFQRTTTTMLEFQCSRTAVNLAAVESRDQVRVCLLGFGVWGFGFGVWFWFSIGCFHRPALSLWLVGGCVEEEACVKLAACSLHQARWRPSSRSRGAKSSTRAGRPQAKDCPSAYRNDRLLAPQLARRNTS